MDKFSNDAVALGASKLYLLARQYGMKCRSLTWNPNYKGVDDWRIALKRKAQGAGKEGNMNFKGLFLSGQCDFGYIRDCAEAWHDGAGPGETLGDFLGLTAQEYAAYCRSDRELIELLEKQRREQGFRIYQLDFSNGQTKPFAFQSIKVLLDEGYKQPPAAEYSLVHEGQLIVPAVQTETETLERIFEDFNDDLPTGYHGRSVAPSDVIELFDGAERRYFYCDKGKFVKVRFSPALAHTMTEDTDGQVVGENG